MESSSQGRFCSTVKGMQCARFNLCASRDCSSWPRSRFPAGLFHHWNLPKCPRYLLCSPRLSSLTVLALFVPLSDYQRCQLNEGLCSPIQFTPMIRCQALERLTQPHFQQKILTNACQNACIRFPVR
ncbi:hypothetical protein BJX68DRAFT_162854 [Aspergillus pseudodeflectus]|uniref:Uncharacterized protein n=1 Tax=Aspergillus pseudodeflectus TaxID=176178 RepID=A0ABR4L142_9EURO